jgi:hypothetical protein
MLSDIEWNPEPVIKSGELIWNVYPDPFMRRPVFCVLPEEYDEWEVEDLNQLVIFTILFADPLSPAGGIRDIETRKKEALKIMKGKMSDLFYREEVGPIGKLFSYMLMEYYKMTHHTKYEVWISQVISLSIMSARLRTPGVMKDSDRRQVAKEMVNISEDLERLELELFKDKRVASAIARRATEENDLSGYAEKYALELKFNV